MAKKKKGKEDEHLQEGKARVKTGRSAKEDDWERRSKEELRKQQPVHREGRDEKSKRDKHAGDEARVRQGRDEQGKERERVGDDQRRQQGRGSESRFVERVGVVSNEKRGNGKDAGKATSQQRESGKRKGLRTESILNTHNRGVMRIQKHG